MAQQNHIALYPGTFDGVTNGHLDIIRRGAGLFEKLIVGVAHNDQKKPFFTTEERVEILKIETAELANVEVVAFEGLTMNYAQQLGAKYMLRGIRVVSDFEYEFQMSLMNRALNPDVETIFMFPAPEHMFISSSLIKEVLRLNGDVRKFVPQTTEAALRRKLGLGA